MRRTFALVIGFFFLAVGLFAGELREYKNWENSPQAYFITEAERAQWRAITTDDDAAAFVGRFVESRGGDAFVAEVAKRAEMADKYLSIGKTKGSTTLRGKLVIVFGPPANVQTADREAKKGYVSPASSAAVTDLGSGGAASGDNTGDTQTIVGGGKSGLAFRDYTFTFAPATSPGLDKEYVVVVEADLGTGTDRLKDRKAQRELDARVAAAAQAMIRQ